MSKLTSEARIQLSMIHKIDVFKVLQQLKIVCINIEKIDEFKDFKKEDCQELVRLTEKYYETLDSL